MLHSAPEGSDVGLKGFSSPEELPDAEAVPFFDTAGAVAYVAEKKDKSIAAIAGEPAAAFYGMKMLRQNIETDASNFTRFYVVTREENASIYRSEAKLNKATLSFSVSDEPGSLASALSVFSGNGVNMKKLESRPIPGKPWEYLFFVECELPEGNAFDKFTEEMKEKTVSFRLLGTYTAAR